MGKRQAFIDLARAGGSRQKFIDLANSFRKKSLAVPVDPFRELTIHELMMSGALPSELKHGGIAGIKKFPNPPPLVKQFVIDDPTTYLTNEDQMKGMLIATLEGEPLAVDQEVVAEVDEQQDLS